MNEELGFGMRFEDPPEITAIGPSPTVASKLDVVKKYPEDWILFVTYAHQSTASNLVARIKRMTHFEATYRSVQDANDNELVEYRVYVRYTKKGK